MNLMGPIRAPGFGVGTYGHVVDLARTDPNHLVSSNPKSTVSGADSFEQMLTKALNGANDLQIEADRLGQQMITDPDSVDTHDVTIAIAEANLAVSLTKAFVDGAIQAYNNIINIR